MLIAKQNNQLIDLRKIKNIDFSQLKSASNYTCPYCGAAVIFKHGRKRRAHFSHRKSCKSNNHHHESEAHYTSKFLLKKWLDDQGVTLIKIEHRLPSIDRIADIYFEYKGKKFVLEIQKSMIDQVLFEERTRDYQKLGIEVIWIFIGEIQAREKTYLLNKVMKLQKGSRIIHFNPFTQTLTLFNHLVWLSQKEVQGMVEKILLNDFSLNSLLSTDTYHVSKNLDDWLTIKQQFRCKKSLSYQRNERGLLRLCAPFLINFSLLPSVVGWPIEGEAYYKPLFIWQGYVVLCIMSDYEEHDVFTLSELRHKLRVRYHLKESSDTLKALKEYLLLLEWFGMIRQQVGYYEYIKRPRLYLQLEPYLIEDKQLGELWIQKN